MKTVGGLEDKCDSLKDLEEAGGKAMGLKDGHNKVEALRMTHGELEPQHDSSSKTE